MLIDVLEDDPQFGRASSITLDSCAEDGLVACSLTYAELAPAFQGEVTLQDEFCTESGSTSGRAGHGWTRCVPTRPGIASSS
jgi:hypothetical protein